MKACTYGTMPTRSEFNQLWDATMGEATSFRFGNDRRVGNESLTQSELWNELNKAYREGEYILLGDDEHHPWCWCSSVLYILGLEWI